MTETSAPGAISDKDAFLALADELRVAASAYYAGDGSQVMDDATYDTKMRCLRDAAEVYGWGDADDLLTSVAGGQGVGDVAHEATMLSLDNAMDDAEMAQFFARVSRGVGGDGEDINWVVEPKFDGMALEVVYQGGRLCRVVTRGNGLVGEDVTRLASTVSGIPATIDYDGGLVVVGECVMTHQDFAEANRIRLAHGDRPFANPRNAVAGSLRSKHRTYQVPLSFYAYGATWAQASAGSYGAATYSGELAQLRVLGFSTAADVLAFDGAVRGTEAALERIAAIEASRAAFQMDTDGAVVKADQLRIRTALGASSRAPRWAIARKFAPDTRETDLLDIEVAVGRTGNLSFTAKVAPVHVGGVTITSVTVHNVSEIARKGLRLPGPDGTAQRVVVRRAGEVIPEIVGVADSSPTDDRTTAFVAPQCCPNGHELDTTSSIIWTCVKGRECGVSAGIRYAVSRDCLDIEGMGGRIVDALVESGAVADVADLFELDMAQLLAVPRLGQSNTTKILAQIDVAKTLPLARIITALGIRGTGRSMSRRIASHFVTMDALRAASVETLAAIEGIGPVKAASIHEELKDLGPVLDRLSAAGIGGGSPDSQTATGGDEEVAGDARQASSAPAPLAGIVVCVTGAMTGALGHYSRNEVHELIESLGGRASSSVSAKTTYLLTADPDTSTGKGKKARELGIEIISPDEFAARFLG